MAKPLNEKLAACHHTEAYYANEGILLEADKMEYNLRLRSVVKISLNNMWGEVGISPEQDPNQRFHRIPQADGVFGLG